MPNSANQGREVNSGFYVMRWVGGRYVSVGWFPTKKDAEQECAQIVMSNRWAGMPPKIEECSR